MKKLIAVGTLCLLFIGAIVYSQQTYPSTGVYCWVAPTTNADGTPLTGPLGYALYLTLVGQPETTMDLGAVTTAPTPPTPSQACPSGSIGVSRSSSTAKEGDYLLQVDAYYLGTVNRSARSDVFAFTVKNGVVIVPKPGKPGQPVVK